MRHQRLEHPKNGPVHVFFPGGWSEDAGITIFVHGWDLKGRRDPWYADALIEDFGIERKVESSFNNSAFVVIESKVGKGKPIYWANIDDLYTLLNKNQITPHRRVHAIGHSGAFANIAMWLNDMALEHVSLLDATYGKYNDFASWSLGDEERALDIGVHKGSGTHKGAWNILKKLPDYHTYQKMPEDMGICRTEYLVFPYSHMRWVEEDDVMIMILNRAQRIRNRGVGC